MNRHEEEAQLGRVYDHRLVRRLLPFLRPYRREMLFTCVALAGYALAQVAWPRVFAAVCSRIGRSGEAAEVRALVLSFVILAAGTGLAEFARYYLSMSACQNLVADLRAALFAHFQRLPLSYFDRVPTGKVLSRMIHDPNSLEDLLEAGFVTMVGNGLHLIGVSVAMLVLDWRMALMAFATVPVLVLITLVYRPLMRRAFRRVREMVSRMNARIEENISGHSAVLVLNQEERCRAELDETNRKLCAARTRASALHALFPPFIHGSLGVGVALIIWYGASGALAAGDGAARLAGLEKLFTFVIYLGMFGWPLQMMMEHVQVLQSAMAGLERIFGFMDEAAPDLRAPLAESGPGMHPEERSRGEIEFRDVWFAYRQEEWILKGLSLRVKPGERVAIAGPTGAGKTTILSLASALYRPQKGKILLDGTDLAQLDPRYVRRQVATVIQDVFLFSDTVAENVRLWEPGTGGEQVRAACARARCSGFVEALEGGYHHRLGQRGGDLSAGQRQLLSFARALAYDPPVLILDEATSAVDAETEENIRRGLGALTRGRTSLIVAHRFSTLADADRLLVIRDGRIEEETTPREFLERRSGRLTGR
jgi:ABC-type multidrug transport system fused ATPase/permease subunit